MNYLNPHSLTFKQGYVHLPWLWLRTRMCAAMMNRKLRYSNWIEGHWLKSEKKSVRLKSSAK